MSSGTAQTAARAGIMATTGVDPEWIKAGASVLGSALSSSPGPSRADAGGGMFDFGSSFTVSTGSAPASSGLTPSTLAIVAALAVAGLVLWNVSKKRS